jgi:sugar O-acyltransferase (sialic acid O-acetyltransferase NeuD family)
MLNFIMGAGGHAREVDWLIEDIHRHHQVDYRPQNFVALDGDEQIGQTINSKVVLSESEFFKKYESDAMNCFIGVGDPEIKRRICLNLKRTVKRAGFPNLIHPSVSCDNRKEKVSLGEGNIICSNTVITTDVAIGNFVTINVACTVGHDCLIEDFVTLSPGVNVAGRVHLGEGVFIGIGARIMERIQVISKVVVGAGATVVKDLREPGTYLGIPARKTK